MRDLDQHEKLAKACHVDQPGTALDRWRAVCVGGLIQTLLGGGRDITIMVGNKTGRKSGDFAVALAEDRN